MHDSAHKAALAYSLAWPKLLPETTASTRRFVCVGLGSILPVTFYQFQLKG